MIQKHNMTLTHNIESTRSIESAVRETDSVIHCQQSVFTAN